MLLEHLEKVGDVNIQLLNNIKIVFFALQLHEWCVVLGLIVFMKIYVYRIACVIFRSLAVEFGAIH